MSLRPYLFVVSLPLWNGRVSSGFIVTGRLYITDRGQGEVEGSSGARQTQERCPTRPPRPSRPPPFATSLAARPGVVCDMGRRAESSRRGGFAEECLRCAGGSLSLMDLVAICGPDLRAHASAWLEQCPASQWDMGRPHVTYCYPGWACKRDKAMMLEGHEMG